MTKDEIIRMAREAGFEIDCCSLEWHDRIERFAKLVRKDYSTKHAQTWIKRINEAVAAEREECAKVCETFYNHEAKDCAEAIRARSQA